MRRVLAGVLAVTALLTLTACGPDKQTDWSKYSAPATQPTRAAQMF
jgi:predicted small lipoprotein YifL